MHLVYYHLHFLCYGSQKAGQTSSGRINRVFNFAYRLT